jgi:hypothetical protein
VTRDFSRESPTSKPSKELGKQPFSRPGRNVARATYIRAYYRNRPGRRQRDRAGPPRRKARIGKTESQTDSDDCTARALVHGHGTDDVDAARTLGRSTATVTDPRRQQHGGVRARETEHVPPMALAVPQQHAARAQGTRWSSGGRSRKERRRPKRSGCSRRVKSRRSGSSRS